MDEHAFGAEIPQETAERLFPGIVPTAEADFEAEVQPILESLSASISNYCNAKRDAEERRACFDGANHAMNYMAEQTPRIGELIRKYER